MTAEEKQKMMEEIMQVVEKHIAKSEDNTPSTPNRYGREYGISDEEMAKWKREYRQMRVEGKKIIDEVRNHPIDVTGLETSFDIARQTLLLKEQWNSLK